MVSIQEWEKDEVGEVMTIQVVLSIITLVAVVTITLIAYNKRKYTRRESNKEDRLTMDRLLEKVKLDLVNELNEDNIRGKGGEEWDRAYSRLKRISSAMRNTVYGIEKDKIIVKDLIKGSIQKIMPTDEIVDSVLDLNNPFIDPMIKWEIMAYYLSKRDDIGKGVIKYLFKKYKVDEVKYEIEDGTVPHYRWSTKECELMYQNEIDFEIPYLDKLEIISTLLYQRYKGFGIIDTLIDMTIDGLHFGTSGSVMAEISNRDKRVPRASASVWIYFEGIYIHAPFFDFYSQHEVRRVVQLLCRYGNPGPLTEKRGYLVTTMQNQSRVLAVRPPVAEYWAVFIRKFDLGDMNLEKLIDPLVEDRDTHKPVLDEAGKYVHKYKNAFIAHKLVRYLMMGQVTCGFTGRQGSGKTTLMKYAITAADARLNLRVLELTFEMYLREIYPERDILAVQETEWVTAAALQDALKKSDAAISIVGEVASDIIAARMIQMGQVASIFTIFSHHANRTEDLIQAITNSIVASSHGAATPDTVEPQVLDVIKVDIHLDYDVEGNRYIERITEVRRLDNAIKYVPITQNNATYALAENQKRYYEKITDTRRFIAVDVLHFDTQTWAYVTDEFFSETLTKHILSRLPKTEVDGFIDFASDNWEVRDSA